MGWGAKKWSIRLSNITVSMTLWFAMCLLAQEVLECVKANPLIIISTGTRRPSY